MSDTLNIAVNSINAVSSRIAKTASSIVNASSTGGNDLASNLVNLDVEKNNYAADAKLIRVTQETNKALLDILA